MKTNSDQLARSSQKWMEAAFAAFTEGPWVHDMAVHHAGVAAEHLLKAYLASHHPVLIVEGSDFDSLLHAVGIGQPQAAKPESKIKTIGLVVAHRRALQLMSSKMPVSEKQLAPLADARNGVAHSGSYDFSTKIDVFTTCLRLIDPLLTELGLEHRFWGRYQGLHDRLIDQRAEVARIHLEGRLAKARHAFHERYGHLWAQHRDQVIEAVTRMTMAPDDDDEDVVEAQCPACSVQGYLTGETRTDPVRDTVIMTPNVFVCVACGLELDREELGMLEVSLAEEVDLDVPPEEYYKTWVPRLDVEIHKDASDGNVVLDQATDLDRTE